MRSNGLKIQGEVIARIKENLSVHGIDLPSPTQQVLSHDQTEEADGDHSRQREGWPAGGGEVPKPCGINTSLDRLGRTLPGVEGE